MTLKLSMHRIICYVYLMVLDFGNSLTLLYFTIRLLFSAKFKVIHYKREISKTCFHCNKVNAHLWFMIMLYLSRAIRTTEKDENETKID